MIRIEVYDKSTDKLVWHEDHQTSERAETELEHMKENHFNPEYFDFKKVRMN